MPPRKRLGQLLTELGVIDDHQLHSALGHQRQWGGKLGAILVQKGFCGEEQLVSALAQHLSMERVKLGETKIDARAVKLVSKQVAEKLHVFPYQVTGAGRSEVISIAMSDPTDLSAVDQLAFHTGKRIRPLLASDGEIVSAIQAHYGATEEKKESTDKVARPAGSPGVAPGPAAGGFPKRIEPQGPAAPAAPARPVSPFAPPTPVPAASPPAPQPASQAPPAEAAASQAPVAAAPVPVDLPEDDAEGMGLEPIAAHSQFGDEVAGQEEIAGEGNAADAIEGLVSASLAHEGAEQARAAGLQADETGTAPPAEGGESWGDAPPGFMPEAAASAESSWPQLESAPQEQGWGTPLKTDEASWGAAQPAGAPAADWASSPGDGWSMQEPSTSAGWSSSEGEQAWTPIGNPAPGEETPSEVLPTDAILGAVQEFGEDPEESGGVGWDAEEPAAEAAAGGEAQEQPGEAAAAQESGEHAGPLTFAESEPGSGLRTEGNELAEAASQLGGESLAEPEADAAPAPPQETPVEPQLEAAAAEAREESYPATDEPPARAHEPDTEPIPEPPAYAVPPEEHEAEPPDTWAAIDDPLAAEAATPETPSLAEGSAAEAAASEPDLSTAEFANPLAAAGPDEAERASDEADMQSSSVEVEASAFDAEAGSAAAEAPAEGAEAPQWQAGPEEIAPSSVAPEQESTERFARQDDAGEAWTPASQDQPQAPGWIGESLGGATPLSPADLGTLASIGVEPSDGVGALRLLAALIRILNRGQLIEPDDLRAEIRESREAGAAAAAQNGVESEGSSSGQPEPPGTTAET